MASNRNSTKIAEADAAAVTRGYEARDVHVGIIVLLIVGFGVLFAGLCGGLWAFYHFELAAGTASTSTPLSAVSPATLHGDTPPLQPQVGHESLDAWDLAKMRAQEDSVFEGLGWQRDAKTHRFVAPAAVLVAMQQPRKLSATTLPTGGR